MEDSRYGMEVIYSGSDQDYGRTMRRDDTCNCYYAMHFVYSIYITSDKGPLIAQKFKFLHTLALNIKLWPYLTNWHFKVHSCVSRRDQEAESDVPPLQRRLEI